MESVAYLGFHFSEAPTPLCVQRYSITELHQVTSLGIVLTKTFQSQCQVSFTLRSSFLAVQWLLFWSFCSLPHFLFLVLLLFLVLPIFLNSPGNNSYVMPHMLHHIPAQIRSFLSFQSSSSHQKVDTDHVQGRNGSYIIQEIPSQPPCTFIPMKISNGWEVIAKGRWSQGFGQEF